MAPKRDKEAKRELDAYFQNQGFSQEIFLFCVLAFAELAAVLDSSREVYLLFCVSLVAFLFLFISAKKVFKHNNYFWVKDICFGGGKIDHVCVGPTGIFAIETSDYDGRAYYYRGHLLMDGRKKGRDMIKEAKEDAAFLGDFIFNKLGKRYYVVPLVILPNALIDKSVKDKKDGIWIGDEEFQNYIIKSGNYLIPREEVSRIVDFLIAEKEKREDEKEKQ